VAPERTPRIRWVAWLFWGGLAAWFAAAVAVRWLGERNGATAFAMYAPPGIWAVPLVVLAAGIPAAGWRRRLAAWLAAAFYLGCVHAEFRWNRPGPPGGEVFKLVSNNAGQSPLRTLQGVLAAERPDAVALQDVPGGVRACRTLFPGWNIVGFGEFILLSRHPILGVTPVEGARWRRRAVAARFEVEWGGERIAVYNVHFPSPRRDLGRARPEDALTGILDPLALPESGAKLSFGEAMAARLGLARAFAREVSREALPALVAGDFNLPDLGPGYRALAAEMTDAFDVAGRGYGYTFPGVTRNPLALFRPWLRLDYQFAGAGWRVVECRVEPPRPAQHLGLIGVYARGRG
jgi:endonuclease/exonuclease/phosphatase family metal-dependent hydrolase